MNNPQELTEKQKKLLEEMQYPHGVLACYPWMTEDESKEYARRNMESMEVQRRINNIINMQIETIENAPLTVEQKIAQAVLEERERCAKIADKHMPDCDGNGCKEIALKIRSGENG